MTEPSTSSGSRRTNPAVGVKVIYGHQAFRAARARHAHSRHVIRAGTGCAFNAALPHNCKQRRLQARPPTLKARRPLRRPCGVTTALNSIRERPPLRVPAQVNSVVLFRPHFQPDIELRLVPLRTFAAPPLEPDRRILHPVRHRVGQCSDARSRRRAPTRSVANIRTSTPDPRVCL